MVGVRVKCHYSADRFDLVRPVVLKSFIDI